MISFANTKRPGVRDTKIRSVAEKSTTRTEGVRRTGIPDTREPRVRREGECDFRLARNFRVPPLHRVGQGKMDVPFATLTPVVPL